MLNYIIICLLSGTVLIIALAIQFKMMQLDKEINVLKIEVYHLTEKNTIFNDRDASFIRHMKEMEYNHKNEIKELLAKIKFLVEDKGNSIRDDIENRKLKEHIAFSASLPSAKHGLSIHQTIVYSKEITDTSSSYNPSDGVFTVPVSGVYIFAWSTSCDGTLLQETELVVDSTQFGFLRVDSARKGDFGSAAQTVILKVDKGQRVWIWTGVNGDGALSGSNFNTFSGWILHTTVTV